MQLRFGEINKHLRNTNVFEHSGKIYVVAENHRPQEIDIRTLESFHEWDVNGAWDRNFTAHPKKAPNSGELVIMGVDATKPYYVLGVISADGKHLLHKVDLRFNRSVLVHELGVTQKYNIVIMDYPLVLDPKRLIKGGPVLKYDKEGYARIGVIPRYGDAESVQWFEVQTNCALHVINCFEEGNEVIVRGCRAPESIIPGPDNGIDAYEWFSKVFEFNKDPSRSSTSTEEGFLFSRPYEWRLNMATGNVEERFLAGTDFSMDSPFINEGFTGLKHKYGYAQVVDSVASSNCGNAKYGGLAKLHFEECTHSGKSLGSTTEELVKVECHKLEDKNFCSGSVFVPKQGAIAEDDGWVVSFVHNEETDITQVHVIDAKHLDSEPIAKITLPQRVPYGFHGTFVSLSTQL